MVKITDKKKDMKFERLGLVAKVAQRNQWKVWKGISMDKIRHGRINTTKSFYDICNDPTLGFALETLKHNGTLSFIFKIWGSEK